MDTRLAPKISQLSGVGLVSISGGQKPAVRIQANPAALESYGIDLENLRTAVSNASVNAAKGNFDGPHQDYQIDSNDQLVTSQDYRKVVVAFRDGAPVMLTDVATIVDGVENTTQAAWMNKQPAIILNVQRQPGGNTITVVKSIKRLLPQLEANLPKGVTVTPLTDLTTAIQASVNDVEFELLLTVALVVMVIFLFLRSLWATIIPSVAVPLSLVGTFGVMYLLGYSLDNLSLMALTISTGFVVDDAIVMLENISRYIEAGDPPMEAALKGAEQIGFTIMSLTVSLIAVLIPLLFMGDVVGRLFREFAVTLAVTIILSAVVSLTLTPMMSARILKRHGGGQKGRVYRASERGFNAMIGFYARTLKVVLRYQTATMCVALGTLLLTVFLYIEIPKGFFPVQDTGVIQGISQAPQTIGSKAMAEKQQELADVILADPAVESLSSFIGADGTNTTTNSGRLSINLKPLDQRDLSAADVIRRLEPELDKKVEGIQLFMQPVQNITVDDRVSRTQYQYTLEDPDQNELNQWTNRFLRRLKELPELEDVATDQQVGGLAVSLAIDRVTASRLGIAPTTIDNTLYDAFGQRQINTMYTQLNQYHVILEAQPQFQLDPGQAEPHVHPGQRGGGDDGGGGVEFVGARIDVGGLECADRDDDVYAVGGDSGAAGAGADGGDDGVGGELCGGDQLDAEQCDSAERVLALRDGDRAAVDHAPGTVPFDYGELQPGAARIAGRCDREDHQAAEGDEYAGQPAGGLSGHGGIVPQFAVERAAADPGRAGDGVHRSGGAVRELHSPDHDPFDAVLGGGGGVSGADPVPSGPERGGDYRAGAADRDCGEERDHDGGLRAGAAAKTREGLHGGDL